MKRRSVSQALLAALTLFGTQEALLAQVILPPTPLRHEGFHPFPTIRTGYTPGTILQTRVDAGGRRTVPYLLPQNLSLDPPAQLLTTSEVVPTIEQTTSVGIGAAIQMLLPRAVVSTEIAAGLSSDSSMKIVFGSGTREMLLGADTDRIVAAAIKRGLPAPGSYSVIVGTISFFDIEATITDKKGGQIDASFRERVGKVGSNIRINSSGTAVVLPTRFSERHRAFYMYQVIRPTSAAIAGSDDTHFELIPGTSALDLERE